MNNFDDIFSAIKEQCTESNEFKSKECYRLLEEMLQGKVCMQLEFYLDSLVHTGIIKYNKKNQQITLTPKGVETVQLFI